MARAIQSRLAIDVGAIVGEHEEVVAFQQLLEQGREDRTIAAAEVGLALGIVLRVFRNRGTANVDEIDVLRW